MSWHQVSLKEICSVDWGNTKLTKSSFINDGEFLAVSAAGADGRIGHYEHEADVPVLSAIGAQCGRMFFPGSKFTAIKNTITLTPKRDITDGKFLYYLFSYLELPQRGAGQPFISKGDIESFLVNVPTRIEEQREIVAKLDAAMAQVVVLENNLVLQEIKATELLSSFLDSAFKSRVASSIQAIMTSEQDSAPEEFKLVEVCKLVGGGTPSKANTGFFDGNIPWATVRDLTTRWLEETEHKINEFAVRESSTNIIPRNSVVLASRVGLGKVVQLRQDTAINQDLRGLVPLDVTRVDSSYLYYWVLSIVPQIIAAGQGATVQGVTLPFLESLKVPLPPIVKQNEVVQKLDSMFADMDDLRFKIKTQKDSAVVLRQSILHHAFTRVSSAA